MHNLKVIILRDRSQAPQHTCVGFHLYKLYKMQINLEKGDDIIFAQKWASI